MNERRISRAWAHFRLAMALVSIAFALASCKALGPKRIPIDRFDYNAAVSRSADEQMLLNLVRLRYNEVPVFLEVSSVLTQYVYSGGAGVGGSWGTAAGASQNLGNASLDLRYVERPTITYSPLSGQEFAAQLIQPVPPELVFSLVQSGWPPDQLLLLTIQRLQDKSNVVFVTGGHSDVERAEAFRDVIALFIQLAVREAIEVRHETVDGEDVSTMVFAREPDPETAAILNELRDLVGLDSPRTEYRITTRVVQREPDEITIRVRSLLELMGFLSYGVEVPSAHVETQRTSEVHPAMQALIPLRVRSQAERPEEAHVLVRHKDHWFYIPDADIESKQAFGLMSYLYQMQAPQIQGAGPLLTVPTGG